VTVLGTIATVDLVASAWNLPCININFYHPEKEAVVEGNVAEVPNMPLEGLKDALFGLLDQISYVIGQLEVLAGD
jgi:hypothetical protein